jgi:hypothetical protein
MLRRSAVQQWLEGAVTISKIGKFHGPMHAERSCPYCVYSAATKGHNSDGHGLLRM